MIVNGYLPDDCSFESGGLQEDEIQELSLVASSKKEQELLIAIWDAIMCNNVTKIGGTKGDWKMSLSRFP